MLGDGVCQEECLVPACENDRGDCMSVVCSEGCSIIMLGDGVCQESCKVEDCQWDKTDCECSPGCSPPLLINTECDKPCNTEICGFDNGSCVKFECAQACSPQMIGNGKCDEVCNSAECQWDGLDCGCAPACSFAEVETCKSECLVVSCGYGSLAGYPSCKNTIASLTQRFYDIIVLADELIFPEQIYIPDQDCVPIFWRIPWDYVFFHCADYGSYLTKSCLYNVGMCDNPTETCERSTRIGCLQCVAGLVNSAGRCLPACPQNTAPHPLVPDLCIPNVSTTLFTVYINSEYMGNDSDGSWERPFRTLEDSISLWTSYYVKVLLVGPLHYVSTSAQALPLVYDWRKSHPRNITISPFECEGRGTCERPTILFSGPLMLKMDGLKNFCDDVLKSWIFSISNVNCEENPNNEVPFPAFFQLGSSIFSLTNVTFARSRRAGHLVSFVSFSHITLRNVNFFDVVTLGAAFQAEIEDNEDTKHYCGEIYSDTTYRLANFTYETGQIAYSHTLTDPFTFFRHVYMGIVQISNVTVTGLNCESGCRFVLADSWVYFELRSCLFADNVMESGSFLEVNSAKWILNPEYMYIPVAIWVSKLNYNISDCVFRNNSFTTGSHFSFTFQALMQNVLLNRLSFQHSFGALIALTSTPPISKQRIIGPSYIPNLHVSFPPALITLQAIEIVNCTSPKSLISLWQIPHAMVTVRVLGMHTKDCTPAIVAERGYNYTMMETSIEQVKCEAGTAGLVLVNYTGYITIKNSRFTHISAADSVLFISATSSTLIEALQILSCQGLAYISGMASLRLTGLRVEGNKGGALYLSNVADTIVNTSEFRYNNATAGGAIQIIGSTTASTSLTITGSSFEGNQADTQGGAIYVFLYSPAVFFRLAIKNTGFEGNKAYTGAVLYLPPRVQLQTPSYLSNVTITRSHSSQGALTLTYHNGTLAMSSVRFEGNIGESESCLYVQFSDPSGGLQNILSIVNSVFLANSGLYTIRFPYAVARIHFILSNVSLDSNSGTGLQLANVLLECNHSVLLYNTGAAVLLSRQSQAVLTEVRIEGNEASESAAGVHLGDQSSLYCEGCVFEGNKGLRSGGAVQAESGSVVAMLNSVFRSNQANDGSALKFLQASRSSLFNCSFTANSAAVEGTLALMSTSLVLTNCFFTHNTAPRASGLLTIEANLTLVNCILENQMGDTGYFLFITSLSYVNLTNTRLSHGESLEEGAIYAEESNIILSNCHITDIVGRKGALLYAYSNAHVTFLHTRISTSTALQNDLIDLWLSTGVFLNTTFSAYRGTAITAQESSISLSHCSFREGESEAGAGLRCLQCVAMIVQECAFSLLQAGRGAAIDLQGLTKELLVVRCSFTGNIAGEGGAIHAQDTCLQVSECVFTNNSAVISDSNVGRGGAVAFLRSDLSQSCLSINRSSFNGNQAEVEGGAIAWKGKDFFPSLLQLEHADNYAPYGTNISSFPISILASSYLSQATSGQPYSDSLIFSLIDHYGQIVTADNSTKAGLSIQGLTASVYGKTEVTAHKGLLIFDDFTIAASLGTNVTLTAVVPGLSSLQNLTIYLRRCEPGESQVEEKCLLCKAPKYSFNPAEPCRDCPSNAVCKGGANIYPKVGYWRYDRLSTTFLQCPNSAACLGPVESSLCEDNNSCSSTGPQTGTCLQGYTGNMCQTCAINYHRTSKVWCTACPSYVYSVTVTIIYALAVTIFALFIVITSIKSGQTTKSLPSVYLKILMNYLQLVMLMGSFNLSWPSLMKELLNVQDSAGSFSEHLFTTDCLEDEYDENAGFYVKLILMSAAPIAFIVISSLCWLLIAAVNRSASVIKIELLASGVILFFLLQPSVMRVMLGAFNCEEVKPGEYWVSGLWVRCWEGKHLIYVLVVALPAIIIWGVGVPGIILRNLIVHRKNLKVVPVNIRYGFLIKGYRTSQFYWEFVIIYRKLLIISIATFLSRVAIMTQALCALSVLVFSLILQHRLQPYSHPDLNTMEHRSILVSVATLFFGLYYLDSSLGVGLEYFFFAVTLGVNIYFLQFWLRKILLTLFLLAVKRFEWLAKYFVVIDEVSVISYAALLKRIKNYLMNAEGRQSKLPSFAKGLFLQKLNQQ